jgi:hypothetical protein
VAQGGQILDDQERPVIQRARTTITLTWAVLLLCGGSTLPGCGTDDPLGDKCHETCQVPQTHPCSTGEYVARCVADCKALAGDAKDKGFQKETCGLCIAGLFKYTGKQCKGEELCTFGGEQEACESAAGCTAAVEKCFGAKGPTSMSVPECVDVCVESN